MTATTDEARQLPFAFGPIGSDREIRKIEDIRAVCLSALRNAGLPDEHAELQLDLLMSAELRGIPSHGLLRLPRVVERVGNGVCDPSTKGRHIWSGSARLEVDGEQGLGPVVAVAALDAASERAKETGVAIAAIRNCDHLGMLAFYAERVAAGGQILLGFTLSEALVHPFGGRHAMIGTNPIAIGVPTADGPFVFDMATSLVSMGKIHDHANRGQPIPEGWALDAHGDPTTDAAAAKGGSIAPFGGAKGYALGLGFELLVASLSASAIGTEIQGTLDSTQPCNKGDLFIVMQPADGMAAQLTSYLDAIRRCESADRTSPVRVPGDRARAIEAERRETGLTVAPEVWRRIQELAASGKES